MFVAQVVLPGSRHRSWTVLGLDGVPVEPVERYLAFLTDVDRSPNTVQAYAHDLKDWFVFLTGRGLDWREVRLEDVGEFVAWLRLSPPARGGGVWGVASGQGRCSWCWRRVGRIVGGRGRSGVWRGSACSTSPPPATVSTWASC